MIRKLIAAETHGVQIDGGVVAQWNPQETVVRIRCRADPADQRLHYVVGECRHQSGERRADDDRGGQVDDIASGDELSEALQHA